MPSPSLQPPPFFSELADKLSTLAKSSPAADLEQNLKSGLAAMLGKLDLVTREEFDVQTERLALAQSHLAALEARVAALEIRIAQQETPQSE